MGQVSRVLCATHPAQIAEYAFLGADPRHPRRRARITRFCVCSAAAEEAHGLAGGYRGSPRSARRGIRFRYTRGLGPGRFGGGFPERRASADAVSVSTAVSRATAPVYACSGGVP